jgi:flagellar basal body-associated protein FliL
MKSKKRHLEGDCMRSTWVLLGTTAQLLLGAALGIFAMFGSASAGDHASRSGHVLTALQQGALEWSIYIVPGVCFLSAATVVLLHRSGARF